MQIPSDSALLQMLLECDSLNSVIVREMNIDKSSNVDVKFKRNFNDFAITFKTIHDTVLIPVIDTLIIKEKAVTITVEKEVNRLHWWQKTLMWAGVIFGLAFLIVILLKIK